MSYYDILGDEAEKMLAYVETGTTDSAEAPMDLPASVYTDLDLYKREEERIFLKMPLLAGLTAEMPKPGDYKALELLGKPILLTRRSDGSVAAMFNVCTHRGMLLRPEGTGHAKIFSCPYHAWSFSNDGKLLAVSEQKKFGTICKEEHNLTQLPVAEAGGIIWVGLTPGQEFDIKAHLGGMLDDLESYGLDQWHYCGARRIYGANWKIAYDGYLEGYHFAAAHPTTIHPRTFSNVMHFTAFGPHLRVGFPQIKIKDALAAIPREEWGKNENNGFDYVRTIFPNVSIFFAPEITQVAQLIPGPTPDQNVTNLLFIRRDPPRDAEDEAAIVTMMDWLADVVDREDYGVGLKVQKGLQSGAIQKITFGKNERGNQYFHKYIDYYLSDDPGKKPPVL